MPQIVETPGHGSTLLTPEGSDLYEERFGERYLRVQWQPHVPSRRERRATARRAQLRNDGSRKR